MLDPTSQNGMYDPTQNTKHRKDLEFTIGFPPEWRDLILLQGLIDVFQNVLMVFWNCHRHNDVSCMRDTL